MRTVKNPILLDANLNDQEMLRPTKGSLSLQLCDVSECSLTLPLDSPNVHMHAWIKVFNQNGFVGIFRRTSNNRSIPNDLSTTFRHGIDILQDSIWDDETDFEGTKAEFLTALLNKQTSLIQGPGDSAPRKPWVLGTCADTSTYKKSIKYNNLLDLFQDLEDEGGDYYFSYNQTVWPWTVSFLQRSGTVASEFRLKRNMEKCRISENDSELCTRLVLQINSMMADSSLDDVKQNKMIARTYNNDAAQAIYGVIVKTEDIDTTDSVPNGPFPDSDAFAAKYLADRAAPLVTVQIDGRELYRQTGDTWDEAQMGTLCRAAIPDYDTYIAQRLVGVNYPDLFGVPDRVVLTLSNATPKTLRDKSNLSRSVASTERTAVRAGGGGRSNAREIESFDQHFKIVDDSNKVLKQAGMHLDANGLLVYADNNQNMVGSRFNVQADKIGMVVGTSDGRNYIKAGEIALSINSTTGESAALIEASHIHLLGETIANQISAEYITAKLATVSLLTVGAINAGGYWVGNTNLLHAIAGIGSATASGGSITIPTTTIEGGTGPSINFNIADTQYYKDAVASAKLTGWNAACDYVTRSDNTIYGPKKNAYGQNTAKYTAHYSAGSDSYSASKLTINGDVKDSGSGTMNGIPWSYTKSSHSHTSPSFYWT